jgi:adenine-specific DNA-methyltransferase
MIVSILENPENAHWELRPFDDGIEVNGKRERWVPYEKIRDPDKTFGWSTWLDKIATNADGTKLLKEMFGEKIFDTPKPLKLLEWVIGLCPDSEGIFLDSFAGSGTTGHAVLKTNEVDGGNRKFILVECEEYADIITAERVRRAIKGYSFQGSKREELMRHSINFSDLNRVEVLLGKISDIEKIERHRFDKIEKKVKLGELIVEGHKSITEKVDGLGGSFTYCTLGESVEMDKMLIGKTLPSVEQLGALLFLTATNEPIDQSKVKIMNDGLGYLGESAAFHVWLIYKPESGFLKSRESALTLTKAREITSRKPEKRHLVFAPAKFVSQKILEDEKIPVEFAPLPWALYQIGGERNGTP